MSTGEAHSERQDGSDHKLERQLHSARYTVISLSSHTPSYATIQWSIESVATRWWSLMVSTILSRKPKALRSVPFESCKAKTLERSTTHLFLSRAESGVLCSKADSAFLVRSLHALSPVIRHLQNKDTFSHGEKFGQDHRKVDCFVDQVNDNEHSISATMHHHHYSAAHAWPMRSLHGPAGSEEPHVRAREFESSGASNGGVT